MFLPPRSQTHEPSSIILGTPKHNPPYILGTTGHSLPYRLAWCFTAQVADTQTLINYIGTPKHKPPYILGMTRHNIPYRLAWCFTAQVADTWTLMLSIMDMIYLKLWHYKAWHYHSMAEVAHTWTLTLSTSGTAHLNISHRVAWHYHFTAEVHLLWFIFGLYTIFLTCSVVSGPFSSTSTAAQPFIQCLVSMDHYRSTLLSEQEKSYVRLRVYWILIQKDQMYYSSSIFSSNFHTYSSFSPAPMASQATPNQRKGLLVVLVHSSNGGWEGEWRWGMRRMRSLYSCYCRNNHGIPWTGNCSVYHTATWTEWTGTNK